VTFTEYDDAYVKYIRPNNQAELSQALAQNPFMTMHQFGPWPCSNVPLMKNLGPIILGLTIQQSQQWAKAPKQLPDSSCKGYYCGHLELPSGQPRAPLGWSPVTCRRHVPVVYSLHDPRGLTSSRIRLSHQSVLFHNHVLIAPCLQSPLTAHSKYLSFHPQNTNV